MIPDFLQEFPNLHPLIVHFPIVLLLLAALTQFAVLFFQKSNQLKWLSFLFMVLATIGAFIAYHTGVHISGDASNEAIEIFEKHKLLGTITLWTSLLASLLRFSTLKWFSKKWVEIILFTLFISVAILVSVTAHHGAQMVYIYGIGPQGNGVMLE